MRRPETWQSTDLWNALESRQGEEAAKAKLTAMNILPEVEEILAKGNSTPGTYTLHDEDHSYRVAQLIASIAGDLLHDFSAYELALLLLSAYLHDIGMTPPAGKVAAHFSYLLTGDHDGLSDDQRGELQEYLDDHWDGRTPPVSTSGATAEEVGLVGRITTAYVREQHNSWGGEWIRENLQAHADDLYAGWLDDLVLLCASHHFGIDQLRHSDFSPRLVGTGDCVCHLRFCACLLRVADILDFDPERTPKVLFAHRDVEDGSIIHWHKNHGIGFSLNDDEITVHAQPSDAVTHHAVVCTVEEVERELLLCDRLDQETQFHRMQGWANDLPHEWRLRTHVQRQINPRGNRYEYVDGTFRPDQSRILDLMGGVELYGDPLVSVRELLQNAFDAVREQIARERLEQLETDEEDCLARLASNNYVLLRLEEDQGEVRLVCRDSGSGMTQDILLSRFLVGGKTANHEIRDLERRCRERGFSIGRTARFGIGVLSYFLLAKRLQLDTRRSIEAGGTDAMGWSFSSIGLEDFGEVSANPKCPQGTTVTLTLKPSLVDQGYEALAERLRHYLIETVRRVPCKFQFKALDAGIEEINFAPGWSDRTVDASEQLLQELEDPSPEEVRTPIEFLSQHDREGLAQQDAYWESIREDAAKAIQVTSEEGDLPEELGTYRIFTGHFELDGDISIPFLDLRKQDGGRTVVEPIGRSSMYAGTTITSTSWNGMEVESDFAGADLRVSSREVLNTLVEIDWTSDAAGRLAVDRNSVRLSKRGEMAMAYVFEEAKERLARLADETVGTPLALINTRLAAVEMADEDADLQWLLPSPDGPELRPIPFPVRDVEGYFQAFEEPLFLEGNTVTPIRAASVLGGRGRSLTWHGQEFVPSRIAFSEPPDQRVMGIWDSAEEEAQHLPPPKARALEFPSSFGGVVGLAGGVGGPPAWNQAHPLVQAVDLEGWKWVSRINREKVDPLSYATELLQAPSKAAAWIIYRVWVGEERLWNGLVERDPGFLPSLLQLVEGVDPDETLFFYTDRFGDRKLDEIRQASWKKRVGRHSQAWLEELTKELDGSWFLTSAS